MIKDLDQITVKKNISLSEAMEKIGARSERILFVIDNQNKLLGTLTDGDIRRALINKQSTEADISNVMCDQPTIAHENYTRNSLIRIMIEKNLLVIPIVSDSGSLVGYETILDLSSKKPLENLVLIMAGGYGKRMRPLTNLKPKPLLEVSGEPILEKIIQQLSESGFINIFISTHYKAEMIKEHFGNGEKWGVNINYLYEEEPLGTAGSLSLLSKNKTNNLPLLILNSDLITTLDFTNLMEYHNSENSILTMCVREYEQQIPFGIVEIDDDKILGIKEKPIKKYFANAGIYVLMPDVLDFLNDLNRRIDMPELINLLISNKKKVNIFPIHEYWMDVGRFDDFKQAEEDLKNKA